MPEHSSLVPALRREQETMRHGVWNLPGVFGLGDLSDDGLERVRRELARKIEDARDGLAPLTDKAVRRVGHELKEIEREQALRAALRYCGAREGGTHSVSDYEAAGGMRVHVADGGGESIVCDWPPSYPLALMLDYRRYLDGGAHVLDWSSIEPKKGALTQTIARAWTGGIA